MPRHATDLEPELDRLGLAEAVRAILAASDVQLVPDFIAFSRSPYASSHVLLDVAASVGGKLMHFVMKDLNSRSSAATRARFGAWLHGGREAEIYGAVVNHMSGPPRCYGSAKLGSRNWLLLERIRGRELTKVGDLRVWARAARWLGRFNVSNIGGPIGFRSGEEYFDRALQRAMPAIEKAPTGLGLGRIVRRWPGIADSLRGMHPRILHGDAFPANVLVGHNDRVCFLDWELAGVGPAMADVAALVSGSWTGAQRHLMLEAYAAGMRDAGSGGHNDLEYNLVLCRVLIAVEMLGALREWEPPSHQRWDWAHELSELLDAMRP